jgi:phytoene/squalene synthetase
MMWSTYRAILARIERDPMIVLRRRVGISAAQKLWIASRVFLMRA